MTSPPYGLATPRFAFPALAALAGRAPLGGEREVALAAFVTARLAAACNGPSPLPLPTRVARAAAARIWLASLALPAVTRTPLTRLVDASGGDTPEGLAGALATVAAAAAPYLDAASRRELDRLGQSLAT